jgi:hypothetical protein
MPASARQRGPIGLGKASDGPATARRRPGNETRGRVTPFFTFSKSKMQKVQKFKKAKGGGIVLQHNLTGLLT